MSLLHRIAVSQGNTARQAKANRMIAGMEHDVVAKWNKSLQAEVYARAGGGLSGRLLVNRLTDSLAGRKRS